MSAQLEEMKLSMRAVINKENTKVLFAEVRSDFADVLLSFLTMPLGTIMRLLMNGSEQGQAPIVASLSSLYQGLENLDGINFWTCSAKRMLLQPRYLLQSESTRYFFCNNWKCTWQNKHASASMYQDAIRCTCGNLLNVEIKFRDSKTQTDLRSDEGGVFVPELASFLITDDLHMKPNVAVASLEILSNLGITDAYGLQEIIIPFGLKEMMGLLKGSLTSKTPLTDLILHNGQNISNTVLRSELQGALMASSLPHVGIDPQPAASSNPKMKMMTVKAIVQKSSNRVIVAQAEEDFVDFLFGLLRIPLGRVLHLLGTNTSVGGISNIYRSLESLDGNKYLKSQDIKNMLLKPQLPPEYLSKNQVFSLTEQKTPILYCQTMRLGGNHTRQLVPTRPTQECTIVKYSTVVVMDLNGNDSYVKGPGTFMVTDDLVVTPSSAMSSLSFLSKLRIPFSDVEEKVFDIGMEEALNILKAAVTSTSALTKGLMAHARPMKQPKQENRYR